MCEVGGGGGVMSDIQGWVWGWGISLSVGWVSPDWARLLGRVVVEKRSNFCIIL